MALVMHTHIQSPCLLTLSIPITAWMAHPYISPALPFPQSNSVPSLLCRFPGAYLCLSHGRCMSPPPLDGPHRYPGCSLRSKMAWSDRSFSVLFFLLSLPPALIRISSLPSLRVCIKPGLSNAGFAGRFPGIVTKGTTTLGPSRLNQW